MTDSKTIAKINFLHPKLRVEALAIYSKICQELTKDSMCRFTHTLRTFEEQDALYSQGRKTDGPIVTNAKGGSSYHNYGLAIDIVLIKNNAAIYDTKIDLDGDGKSDWIEVVNIFKQHGWEWGGDWKFSDTPHFQKTFGHSIKTLSDLHSKKIIDKNNYVII